MLALDFFKRNAKYRVILSGQTPYKIQTKKPRVGVFLIAFSMQLNRELHQFLIAILHSYHHYRSMLKQSV